MRKISLFLGILTSIISVFGYSSTDASNAEFLANQWIITSQSSAKWYRLDDNITRAEAVGIALKVKWVTLPEKYACMNYFTDVRYNSTNNWICRAAELAADNWLVTRENAKFRPQDNITKAEALAILVWQFDPEWRDFSYSFDTTESWQRFLLWHASTNNIIDLSKLKSSTVWDWMGNKIYYFYPNRPATRAEVFSFARNILPHSTQWQFDVIQFPANAVWEHLPEDNLDKLSFWNMVTVEGYQGESLLARECTLYVVPSDILGWPFFPYYSIDWIAYINSIPYFTATLEIWLSETVILWNKYTYTLTDHTASKNCLESLKFNNLKIITQKFVLENYYSFIDRENYGWAFLLRSPAGVSEETFQSWYKNVTSVVFRENTLKDLWDKTYEFLVDMTENGVKTTYKVKSKVDLENFKINNISSVKQ